MRLPLKSYRRLLVMALGLSSWVGSARGQAADTGKPDPTTSEPCEKTVTASSLTPTRADPYPINAAGWGPAAGNGLFYSRWIEDWTVMRATGEASPLKAMPLGGEAYVTFSAEARWRYEMSRPATLTSQDTQHQGLFRGIFGADLQLHRQIHVYGELGSGQVASRRHEAVANYQNDVSLQQLLLEARHTISDVQAGVILGRQEFADGPRQLISLSDGPNLHRTWNGLRGYLHGSRWRIGAFDLQATRLKRGGFDDATNPSERLRGLNGSVVFSTKPDVYLDPFWMHTEKPDLRVGALTGLDERDTYGVRLWGGVGNLKFDWTLARQTGAHQHRDVEAWGLFAVQSWTLADHDWKPRLTSHVDFASGGGSFAGGTLHSFNPLYPSSAYLGEGRFLSLGNLFLIAPGISLAPTATVILAAEYGFARRDSETDAVYAGGMRAYPRTQNVRGRTIGGLLRVTAVWSPTPNLNLTSGFEYLSAGPVLQRSQVPSRSFAYTALTFRY